VNPTEARALYDRQLQFIEANQVDELIDNNYREDAVLMSFDNVIEGGRQVFKDYFREYLKRLGGIRIKSTDKFTSHGDMLFFEATVVTGAYGEVKVYDAMIVKDGQIQRHFTGVK
jgi:methionine synthase II (cobalamin-independent)